jgi:hypothetical protein
MNNLKRRFAKIAIALLLPSPIAAAQRPASTPRPNYGGGHHTQSLGGRYKRGHELSSQRWQVR